ncbi:alanine racemase [Blastopirellula marina]|uniref:Alanine racemase n=1 Tax=Blastopirellula marina TaxID=124 RepID=A0A2S8F0C3_9BACT|nr:MULTISPECIES: alanine racemase [Pirellulaceae]PQO25611.1 alanine racemase [Blastopirellula marina]RCS43294.1 D-TA family PLP-dependent enzyme [Bremerella cremea]
MFDRLMSAKLTQLATPCLVVDSQLVLRNLEALQQYAQQHDLHVRPHAKTHKSLRIAREQLRLGSQGLSVAKVGEAEVLSQSCDDILVAYPAVDSQRCERISNLAKRINIRVAVDSRESVDMLAGVTKAHGTTVGILIDQDVGFHRTGMSSPEAVVELATYVVEQREGVRFDGIFFYPGHVTVPAGEQPDLLRQIDAQLQETIERCREKDIDVSIVSGGSTPSMFQSHHITSQSEIRPGTYVFNDMNTVRGGFCSIDQCAAVVIATVVSTAVAGKAVVDAGTKALASDRNWIVPDSGFGHVIEYPEAKIVRLSEEHGEIDFSKCSSRPGIGERVAIIPNHICPCLNLHDSFLWLDDTGQVERTPVDCRGMLQ